MEQESKREAYHRQVAEKLIKQLEQGTAPWQRPWRDAETMPFNAATGKAYKGVNTLQLMSEGYSDPRWMTYVQAKSIGAQVKAGEKGTVIHYSQYEEERVKRDKDGKPVLDEQGETVKETVKLIRPKNFQAHVFNIEQIDHHNLPPLPPKSQQADWNPIARAEQILAASGASISHQSGNRAFYKQDSDRICLPEKSQFASAEGYYDTALHELGHWTGHESRLNRDLKHSFGSQGYAKEELRAEIASMMLAGEIGIAHDSEQNAAYVGAWIKVLKDDPQEIYRAAKDAEQIQRYVLGLEQKQQLAQEQEQQEPQTQTTTEAPSVQVSLEPQPFDMTEAAQVYSDNVKRLESLLAAHPEHRVQDIQQAARAMSENGYSSHPIYNETLPDDWTGEVRIVPSVRDVESGQIIPAEQAGRPPEGYAVYARKGDAFEGEAAWKPIVGAKTQEEAQAKVEHIRLIDALVSTNPYDQAVTLALIEAERVWNNPSATDEEKEQAKEALDVVMDLADMAGMAGQAPTSEVLTAVPSAEPVPAPSPATTESPALEIPSSEQVSQDNKAKIAHLLSAHPEPIGQRLRETAYALQKDGLDSQPVFGQILPHDWTGEVRVVPSVRDIESGQVMPAEQAGRPAEGYAVYAHKGEAFEGEQAWQAITASKTEAQAQSRAEQLQLLDALLQNNPYNQAVQLAYIERERVARNPEATDKQRSEAKEAVKSAQSLAELAELKQQQAQQQTVYTAQSAGSEQPNERHYLKTAFKDREQVKKLGAKWDAAEKLWYVPEGIDQAAFAKWPQTTPQQAKAERAQNAPQASQAQAPQATPAKRHYLAVPFERKDEAKAAGARWDKAAKAWYAGPQADMETLAKFKAENISIQQALPIRPQEEFAAAMRSIGLVVDGEHPIMDGKSHRVAVEGGKKGAKDGFYVAHLDGRPAGSISNNRTGA
ncbi:hypothetical protein AXE65_04870, partial [Ventosimonas gracilis]